MITTRIILFLYLLSAVFWDSSKDKIPNWLCVIGAVSGLFLNWYHGGVGLFFKGIEGSMLVLGILLPFWVLSVVGGGDVKLMMMAGCYLGPTPSLVLLGLSAICNAIYGLVLLICRKNFRKRMSLFMQYIKDCIMSGTRREYPFNRESAKDRQEGGIHVSYGILAGYIISLTIL
ncbi:MAG: A24 family peptidase [Lachnospiraceae bacterium]|nr:A24 family peptidase [Lachnospiraceae bacterium]